MTSRPVGYFLSVVAFRNFMIQLLLELSIVRQGAERFVATADDGMQGISAGPAFLVGIVAIPLLSRLLPRIGLLDLPDGRKIHDGMTPFSQLASICSAGFILLVVISLAPDSGK